MAPKRNYLFLIGMIVCGAPSLIVIVLDFFNVKIALNFNVFLIYFFVVLLISVYFILKSIRARFSKK